MIASLLLQLVLQDTFDDFRRAESGVCPDLIGQDLEVAREPNSDGRV